MSAVPQTTPAAADRITAIIQGLDALAVQMEDRWGVGRLPLLVSVDLREKFDRQTRLLNGAVWAACLPDVELHAARMTTAWAVLDKAATDAGHEPIAPEVWEAVTDDGRVLAICRDDTAAHKVARSGRYVEVWSLAEVGRVLGKHSLTQAVGAIKQEFPGAKVQRWTTPLNDALPAGFLA